MANIPFCFLNVQWCSTVAHWQRALHRKCGGRASWGHSLGRGREAALCGMVFCVLTSQACQSVIWTIKREKKWELFFFVFPFFTHSTISALHKWMFKGNFSRLGIWSTRWLRIRRSLTLCSCHLMCVRICACICTRTVLWAPDMTGRCSRVK